MDSQPTLVALTACVVIATFGTLSRPCLGSELVTVSGLITDYETKPVSGINVRLRNEETRETRQGLTDKHGRFSIAHEPWKSFTLEVTPRIKTSLSPFFMERIPGNEPRQLIIHLQRGFTLSGRVHYAGSGLKSLEVIIVAKAGTSQDTGASNLGRAITRTDKHGVFHCVVTPGDKVVIVSNTIYSNLAAQLTKPITVTSDTRVPDLELPAK